MSFPDGYSGVKKVFTSEILNLIAAVCLLCSGGLGVIAVVSAANEVNAGTVISGAGAVVLILAWGVLSLLAFILKLVGLKKAGNEEPNFNTAFILAIFGLILTVVAAILGAFNIGNGIADNIARVFVNVANIVITVLIVGGVANFAQALRKPLMIEKGSRILIFIIIMYAIAIIATLIPIFFGTTDATTTISGVLDIVAAVFNLIAYILFLVYLGQAKIMLRDN